MQPTHPTPSPGPRIVRDMPPADYHAHPAISSHGLADIRKSPAIYRWKRDNPPPPTPQMRMGTLIHLAVLEPDRFASEVVVAPNVDRRTSAGKAEWAQFVLEAGDREVIDADEQRKIIGMQNAVFAHPAARKALGMDGSEVDGVEQSLFWEMGGVACRARLDLTLRNAVITDLKTASDASWEAFSRAMFNFRYDGQSAFYWDGYTATHETHPKAFVFVVVEPEPPHLVAVYVPSAETIAHGRLRNNVDLATYSRCLMHDEWPGLGDKPIKIDLPKWATV